MSRVYEPGALFVARSGEPAGPSANQSMLDLEQRIEVRPRHVYETGDLALLVVDWRIGDLTGTATDVARRDRTGRWRYVIDNPFGTA